MIISEEGLNGKQIEIQLPPVFYSYYEMYLFFQTVRCNGLF